VRTAWCSSSSSMQAMHMLITPRPLRTQGLQR
jgi:hypothetical protein